MWRHGIQIEQYATVIPFFRIQIHLIKYNTIMFYLYKSNDLRDGHFALLSNGIQRRVYRFSWRIVWMKVRPQ